jgi:GT2 family glycosyltransferase
MSSQRLFSIIIPTCGRPRQLTACIQSLAALRFPRDQFEVVVVDDGDDISLDGIVAPFCNTLELRLIRQANAGPAIARNTGGLHATGEFLAFTDDDCAPAPGWLTALVRHFAKHPDWMIGGRTINALPDNPYSTASQLLVDYLYGYYNAKSEDAVFFTSNNLALSAHHFRAVGGFDQRFPIAAAEDREFCDRWISTGHRMVYAPDAIVYHSHSLTCRKFLQQHFGYGRGAYAYHRIRAERGAGAVKVEPLSFYSQLLKYPLSQSHHKDQAVILTALLLGTQVLNAAGFFWERGTRAITR